MAPLLITELREAGEDFEWYPTTDEMIAAVVRDLRKHHERDRDNRKPWVHSILDIGAGDGRVLTALAEACANCDHLYAIEKATVHIEKMPANIAIVGTDFHGQTLIDKDVDIVFCNPPYSEYEDWAVKIIKEALCQEAYLILPKRWGESVLIKAALAAREAKAKVVWSGDFAHADRPARASVDIVCVSLCERQYDGDSHPIKKDPFDAWFHETFPEVEVLDSFKQDEEGHSWERERISAELLAGYNLVDRLVELYQREMNSMHASYRSLCAIDPGLLATVGVKAAEVKEGLRKKISGLKNKYWQELFDHLDKIKDRLTHKCRDRILETMGSAVHVDFTADNAYAVVLWILKNANDYINSQLVDLFKELSRPENVTNYKSNQKTWKDEGWRYYGDKPEHTHYKLEYRIVTRKYCAIEPIDKGSNWHSKYDYPNGLHKDSHNLLEDIGTVASNLGFSGGVRSDWRQWSSGTAQKFLLDANKDGEHEVLMRVRAFINGNLHIQFHQGFIKALNVEASRLLGWIKTPKEACDEMGIDMITAQRAFNCNRIFAASEYKLLTA